MAKVLCKPCFETPHFKTGRCVTGHFKSARIGLYTKFQKHIHDGLCLGAGDFKMGKFKTGFAENLGHSPRLKAASKFL